MKKDLGIMIRGQVGRLSQTAITITEERYCLY